MSSDVMEKIRESLAGWKNRLQSAGAESTYVMVSAAALWPMSQAMLREEITTVIAMRL